MKAELVPDNGDPPIPITKDVTVVGRKAFCDVVIDDESLSKRHCVLVKTDGLLVVRDLATTNGTKVKGQKVRWAALLPEDRLAFGGYKVRVYLGPDNAPAPSERADAGNAVRPATAPAKAKAKAGSRPVAPPPAVPDAGLEILDDDSDSVDDDSGWRRLLTSRPGDEDDVVIDLD